jgi:hypothetical protein
METEKTLSKEQIEAWRKVIFIQLEDKFNGAGAYALVMPESEIIAYWQIMKAFLEKPKPVKIEENQVKISIKKKECNHSNSITGGKGKYCLDCEKYV